ncbi:MAG: SpvB/TcaC N-terminal domain-containing protein, partial [Bacteroidota bacterium]
MKTLSFFITILLFTTSILANSTLDTIPQQKRPGHYANSIEGFTAADPVDGIPIMQAPIANSKGGAHTSFPIKLPPARQGMTPVLGLEYNSENDNSWTGLGWDMSISEITIDTRWGVPRYDAAKESETYLLDGAQLFPIFHRAVEYDREADRQFHQRIEGNFHRIIRHGSSPKNYFWEIRDKQGVVNYYGGTPEEGLIESSVLKDDFGNIAHWQLVWTQDPNGNTIEYEYQIVKDKGLPNGTVDGSEIYPLAIYYNGHLKTKGDFSVHFKTDRQLEESQRRDVEINARLGFKRVSTDRLREIEVRYKEQTIRTYELNYVEGAFYKTLLSTVKEWDSEGQLFYEYEFDYYQDILDNGQYKPYEAASKWEVPKDNISAGFIVSTRSFDGDTDFFSDEATVLGSSATNGRTIGGSLTFGPFNPLDPLAYISKKNTVGGHYSNAFSFGFGIAVM